MVTAAFRHCLLNRIALEIMVGVIYLCNSARLVIVHVGISCRICFLLPKGRKEHALYWKWPGPPLGQHIQCLYTFRPSLARMEALCSCRVPGERWWLSLNWLLLSKSTSGFHGTSVLALQVHVQCRFPSTSKSCYQADEGGVGGDDSPTQGCVRWKSKISFMGPIPWDEVHYTSFSLFRGGWGGEIEGVTGFQSGFHLVSEVHALVAGLYAVGVDN